MLVPQTLAKRVIVETPYDQASKRNKKTSLTYAKACIENSMQKGEVPHSSTVPSTDVLVAVYVDLGITPEMRLAIEAAMNKGLEIEYRSLPPERLKLVPDVDLIKSILSKKLMFGKANKLELRGLPEGLSEKIKSGGFKSLLLET